MYLPSSDYHLSPHQWSGASAPSLGVGVPGGTGCCGDRLRARLPSVALATEAALPPPAGDLGVLLRGCLLLLPASVRQPAEAGEAQTAVRRRCPGGHGFNP